MQVFEDHHQRVLKRLAQNYARDCVERAAALYFRVHLRQRIGIFWDCEQIPQIWRHIGERRVECAERRTDLLAPRGRSVRVLKIKNNRAAAQVLAATPRPCRATLSKLPATYIRAAALP